MDTSNIDSDFDISIEKVEIQTSIYDNNINIDDELIIFFKQDEFYGKVIEIDDIDKIITLEDELNNFVKLKTDDYLNILLTTDEYEIIDIEKVLELTEKQQEQEFDDIIVETLKNDIYPEIKLETVEKQIKDYEYTKYQQKEILLSSIIDSLDVYDNKNMIADLSDNLEVLLSIPEKTELNYLSKYNKIPYWILPVSTGYKKVYSDGGNSITEKTVEKPNIIYNQYVEQTKNKVSLEKATDYFDYLQKTFNSDSEPVQYVKTSGYCDEYNGKFLMNFQDFNIDSRKTRNSIEFNDKQGINKTIIKDEKMCFDRFILFPKKYLNLNFKSNIDDETLTLKQKLYNYKQINLQDYKECLKEALDKDTIFCNLDDDTINYDKDKIIIFKTTENLSKKDFFDKIKQKFPSIPQILDEFNIPIYNYLDLNKLLFQYNINDRDFSVDDKEYVNKLIKKSVKDVKQKKYNFEKYIQQKKIKIDRNPIQDAINIKNILYRETNIIKKNYYMNKFIDKYTKTKLNSNWLHSIYTGEPILCKHYKTSCKTTTDKHAYTSLIENWAGNTIDGIVYCKNCNEYLAPEDFSLLEGFDGDKPIQTKEVIKQDVIDEFSELSSIEINDIKLIKLLSVNIGINIKDSDILDIIKLYKLCNNDDLADSRYQKVNTIKQSYPTLIDAKQKVSNDKFIKLQNKIKNYIHDSNKVIFLYCCILILVQINVPGYQNVSEDKETLNINDKNFLKLLSESDKQLINVSGVNLIFNKIKALSTSFKNSKLWKNCNIFISEEKNPSVLKPQTQIQNTIIYILSPYFPLIMSKIKNYYNTNVIDKQTYLKKYWNTYKPLPNNKLVSSINNSLNTPEILEQNKKYFIKLNLVEYALENINKLVDINDGDPIYKQYSIKISDIMNNSSFERLYNYTIYLHGNHDNSDYINNLINRFIDTIDAKNKPIITQIFEKNGYDKSSMKFKHDSIKFNQMKKILLEIVEYYKLQNKTDIETNDHEIFNNIKLPFINTLPKRIYNDKSDDVFSNINSEELLEKFKNKFCYDINKNIIKNTDNIVHLLSPEYSINKIIPECSSELDDKNIKQLTTKLYTLNKLQPIYVLDVSVKKEYYVDRIYNFINKNQKLLKDENLLNLYDISNNIINESGDDGRHYDEVYKNIKSDTKQKINDIIEFIESYEKLIPTLKKLNTTKNIFGNNYNIIKNMFYPPKPGDDGYDENKIETGLTNNMIEYYIDYIFRLTSSISNYRNADGFLPTWWGMSDYNHLNFIEFLRKNDMVYHNEIFLPSTLQKNSYKKYFTKHLYFKNLFDYIKSTSDDIYLLKGKKDTLFNKDRSERLQKYVFVNLLKNIIVYIEKLSDQNSKEYQSLNIIYNSSNGYSIDECIEVLSDYFIELLIDIIQEYVDPTWIQTINENKLREKLSLQKEREKLDLTNKLDKMDANQRYVYVQKQNIGAVNWFKNAEQSHQEYINSEEFKQNTLKERLEYLKNIYNQNSNEIDAMKIQGMDVDVNLPDIQQQEEGYYNEQDIDGEGESEEYIDMNVEDEDIMGT